MQHERKQEDKEMHSNILCAQWCFRCPVSSHSSNKNERSNAKEKWSHRIGNLNAKCVFYTWIFFFTSFIVSSGMYFTVKIAIQTSICRVQCIQNTMQHRNSRIINERATTTTTMSKWKNHFPCNENMQCAHTIWWWCITVILPLITITLCVCVDGKDTINFSSVYGHKKTRKKQKHQRKWQGEILQWIECAKVWMARSYLKIDHIDHEWHSEWNAKEATPTITLIG